MFIITRDLIEDGRANGTFGPSRAKSDTDTLPGLLRAAEPGAALPDGAVRFRMRDGDGELYYEGVYIDWQGSDEFEPLDCFGVGSGCVAVDLKDGPGGKWSAL